MSQQYLLCSIEKSGTVIYKVHVCLEEVHGNNRLTKKRLLFFIFLSDSACLLYVEFVFCCGLLWGVEYMSISWGSALMGPTEKWNVKAQGHEVCLTGSKGAVIIKALGKRLFLSHWEEILCSKILRQDQKCGIFILTLRLRHCRGCFHV